MKLLKWMIGLYPTWWRERYEAEFAAMLDQYPRLRLTDYVDVLWGAVKAHLSSKPHKTDNPQPVTNTAAESLPELPPHGAAASRAAPVLEARCMSCSKQFVLSPLEPQYQNIKTGKSKLYVCKSCSSLMTEEAVHSSGIRPELLDPKGFDKHIP